MTGHQSFTLAESGLAVFHQVARKVLLPELKSLKLAGIRCKTEDLFRFLVSHSNLETLSLKNLDLTGEDLFDMVLGLLELRFNHLQSFHCYQIAQRGFRIYFKSLGSISVAEGDGWESVISDDNFLIVATPNKYVGDAESWEGVQQKIGLLRGDLWISEKRYQPDFGRDWPGWYVWTEQP